jgi:hypothetical protein
MDDGMMKHNMIIASQQQQKELHDRPLYQGVKDMQKSS